MSQPWIVQGDKTSHGGTVITWTPFTDIEGKGVARMGDMVSCPKCKGIFPIAQGDDTLIIDGKPVAYHGCKTACGAMLISGQVSVTREAGPSSGDSPGHSVGTAITAANSIGNGLLAHYAEEQVDDELFTGRFQLIDEVTGKPVAGHKMRVRSTSGQYIEGTTDDDGFTEWIEHDAAEALAFDLSNDNDEGSSA